MKELNSPEFGPIVALEDKDLRLVRPTILLRQRLWYDENLAAFEKRGASGLFVLVAAIYAFHVPPRGGARSVRRIELLVPGLTYGSDLWEATQQSHVDALRAAGATGAFYKTGISNDIPDADLQEGAAREVAALREKVRLAR